MQLVNSFDPFRAENWTSMCVQMMSLLFVWNGLWIVENAFSHSTYNYIIDYKIRNHLRINVAWTAIDLHNNNNFRNIS